MARTFDKDRFVPPIMYAFRAAFSSRDATQTIDRKTDDGERVIAGRRASPRSSINESALRQELVEDMSALLNTVHLASAQDMAGFDHVQNSILNFGVADLTAISTESRELDELSKAMTVILERYEPRLIPGTVAIKQSVVSEDATGHVRLHITADMYSTPVDVAVEFVAEIEPDSGKMKLSSI